MRGGDAAGGYGGAGWLVGWYRAAGFVEGFGLGWGMASLRWDFVGWRLLWYH